MPEMDEFDFFDDYELGECDDTVSFIESNALDRTEEADDPLWDLDDEWDDEDDRKGTGRGFDSEG